MVASRPDLQLICLGAVGMGDVSNLPEACRRLVSRPNVHLIEAKPQAELPAFLLHADVALIPFQDNEHTRSSFPLKFWEYAAAGLPIVARDLPNFADASLEDVVYLASDSASFVERVDQALQDTDGARLARHEIARAHDWRHRSPETTCQRLRSNL